MKKDIGDIRSELIVKQDAYKNARRAYMWAVSDMIDDADEMLEQYNAIDPKDRTDEQRAAYEAALELYTDLNEAWDEVA